MFRYITAILLTISFAAQTFQQAVIVVGYYTNTASYAKACENKAKPMMHCNGKCQMMKKLQEEERRDQQSPERKLENKVEVVSSKSFFAGDLSHCLSIPGIVVNFFQCAALQHRSISVFHPPSFA